MPRDRTLDELVVSRLQVIEELRTPRMPAPTVRCL